MPSSALKNKSRRSKEHMSAFKAHNAYRHLHTTGLLFPFFFFNDTATTEIYTLSLHDALPISDLAVGRVGQSDAREEVGPAGAAVVLREPVQAALELHVLPAGEEEIGRAHV